LRAGELSDRRAEGHEPQVVPAALREPVDIDERPAALVHFQFWSRDPLANPGADRSDVACAQRSR